MQENFRLIFCTLVKLIVFVFGAAAGQVFQNFSDILERARKIVTSPLLLIFVSLVFFLVGDFLGLFGCSLSIFQILEVPA